MNTIPWVQRTLQAFGQRVVQYSWPQTMMITLPENMGGLALVYGLAKLRLCLNPIDAVACEQCSACMALQQQQHQDCMVLQPEVTGLASSIKIDAIRMALSRLQVSAKSHVGQVLILHNVDKLTQQAANALLKSLEEPKQSLLLLLHTDRPDAVLATIRSRCVCLTAQVSQTEILSYMSNHIDDASWCEFAANAYYCQPLRSIAATEQQRQHALFSHLLRDWFLQKHPDLDVVSHLSKNHTSREIVAALSIILYACLAKATALDQRGCSLFRMLSQMCLLHELMQRCTWLGLHTSFTHVLAYQRRLSYGVVATADYHLEALFLKITTSI